MRQSQAMQFSQRRILLFCLGAGAGLTLWQLAENWDNPSLPPALYVALLSFSGSYAILALALVGPVSVRRALVGALTLALPFTALISLAGLRYDLATDVLQQPVLVSVSLLFLLVATPFLIVWLQDRRAWRSYASLFETAWALTIRYLLAWMFVGLFWLMMFLSDALLQLVNVEIIEWITDIDWLVYALTGGVLGLAMAVIYELRTSVSPFLLLRLLRLLVVPVLAVVMLFLAAIPLRGLSQVFGDFSAAATLMSVGMVMVTLIAVVLERDDARMRDSVTISTATRVLALLLPLVTGLAAWSIWLRVSDYGWTPDRVLAACVSAVLLGYGGMYAVAVLRRQGWAERIRRANVVLALVTLAISAGLLTPLLNTDRISANSQVTRFLDGRLPLEKLPLWELKNDWGRAGKRALAALENTPEEVSPGLRQRLQDLQQADSRWALNRREQEANLLSKKASLIELLPLLPDSQSLALKDLEGLEGYQINGWLSGCRKTLADGRPGCVLVMDQFNLQPYRQGILLYRTTDSRDYVKTVLLKLVDVGEASIASAHVFNNDGQSVLESSAIEKIFAGDYSIGPSSVRALHIGPIEVMPVP